MPAEDLARVFRRRFVPAGGIADRWEAIEPLGEALLARVPRRPGALVGWLEDASELAAWVAEEGARRYIAMTAQTDDAAREAAYLAFVRDIEPRWQRLTHRLDEAYLASPGRARLPPRFAVFDRKVKNRASLHREANLPLFVQEAEFGQQYQKLRAAMTVQYGGRELTLEEAARFLEAPDAGVRREIWALIAERMARDRGAMDDLFDRLRQVRTRIAANAGFPSYRDYAFRARERFDYGIEECVRFHTAVAASVVPLATRLLEERRRGLGAPSVRPWDLDVDPLGRPPLPVFERAGDLLDACGALFARIAPAFVEQLRFMRERGLLDIERRKGKAPGGYQETLAERRWPFIFLNVPPAEDVHSLLHEAGHAFHALAARSDPILAYRDPPLEFAEVASMGMELLSAPHLGAIYARSEDAARAKRALLESVLVPKGMPWIATIDAFQHWIYTHPSHTVEERERAWVATYRRFQPAVDWSGCEADLASFWHRQLHLFLHPFYYIEYGVAELGALQLWAASRADYASAVDRYRRALSLGGSRPLPELFEAAGARFGFGPELMAPLAQALADALFDR
jgi:oligoendopeptidase F